MIFALITVIMKYDCIDMRGYKAWKSAKIARERDRKHKIYVEQSVCYKKCNKTIAVDIVTVPHEAKLASACRSKVREQRLFD